MTFWMLVRLTTLVLSCATITAAAHAYQGSADAGKLANRDATLNRMIGSYPKTLNPVIYSLAVEADIINRYTVFEFLIDTHPDTGEPSCWLCVDYAYDEQDKKVITFNIRQDVKFHDGKPLSAEDVKFSYDAMVHPKVDNLNLKSDILAAVKSMEVLSPHVLKVTFNDEKYSNIYQVGSIPIVPKHLFPYFDKKPEDFNRDQKFGRSPIGSGPYKFKQWQAGKFVELERNDAWWGFADKSGRFDNTFNFKRVRFKIVTNDNVAMQAFKKGEFDFMTLQSFQFDELKKSKEQMSIEPVHLDPSISTSFMFIAYNARLPKFADVKTREALALLTDRFSVLQKFAMGLRPPTNGPWGVKSPYQCPEKDCPVVPFDPTKAKKLLAEAGWADTDKDGVLDKMINGEKHRLSFPILAGEGDYYRNVLGVYVTEMRKAGIDAQVRQLDWTAMIKLIDDLSFEAYMSGFQNAFPILPRQLWHSENTGKTGSNSWAFVDKEADQLIAEFEKEFDATKRQEIGKKLHKRIYDAHAVTWHHEGGGCYLGRSKELQGMDVAQFRADCVYWPRWYKAKSSKVDQGH